MTPLLKVENLQTQFHTRAGVARAVDDVSFTLQAGEVMGLVGESGSGKSITGYSLMGLIGKPGKVVGGQILFKNRDLRTLPAREFRRIRGNRIAMIFQDPMMTLNPVLRIDTQMIEAIQAHKSVSRAQARAISLEALQRVGIAAADERLQAYPHQLSGGMRQRVAIAIALLNEPDLIICDEPTTALDVTIQGQILYQMQKLCRETGTALIWITHDLSVVAGFADSVSVMYAGKIVESGPTDVVLGSPQHPYTRGLIACAPSRNQPGQPLAQIPGSTPSLLDLPDGCAFRLRCPNADQACHESPDISIEEGRSLRCFHPVTIPLEDFQP